MLGNRGRVLPDHDGQDQPHRRVCAKHADPADDGTGMRLLIGTYGLAGIRREDGAFYLVMTARGTGKGEETEHARIRLPGPEARLRAEVRFPGSRGEAQFFRLEGEAWIPFGPKHTMRYTLDHFTGGRFGLFMYSTTEPGGTAAFSDFQYLPEKQ